MIQFLADLGINLAASAIWDLVKSITTNQTNQSDLETKLADELEKNQVDLQGAKMKSKEIIKFLIENGALKFNGASIYSDTSIVQKTEGGGIGFSKNSDFSTPNTIISINGDKSFMKQQGNVEIIQDHNGISITVKGTKNDKPGSNSFSIRVEQ
ncbi:hypothetical protein [Myroides odoratus]|uniref:hypothetical protein n=1 Tax=Myroides odoratus TaxID=256 RepID=UPI0039AF3416